MVSNSTIITPQMFGAKGDCIADDLPALQAAVNYLGATGGVIDLGNKIYRITDRWVVGKFFVDEIDCFDGNITVDKPKSYNTDNYIASVANNPIKIIANGGGIYGDFTSETLKAIIYYNCIGDTRATGSTEKYNGGLENVGLYGKGAFINGEPYLLPLSAGWKYDNKQVGIVCLYTIQMKIKDCTFYGLQEGVMMNNSYFSNIESCYFKLCERGIYHIQSHGSIIFNVTAFYCNKGYEIISGQISMININTENCGVGLHLKGGKNVINGSYLEGPNCTKEAQLIIGETKGDECYGNVINALTIVATLPDGSFATAIKIKDTATFTSFNGGQVQTGNIISTVANNVILYQNISGTFPSSAYSRNDSINVKNIYGSGNADFVGLSAKAAKISSLITSGLTINGNQKISGEINQSSNAGVSIKSKIINGIAGCTDYILKLGKYSTADGTKINGVLNIIGNSVYTACGFINISYSNLVTGYAKAGFSAMVDTKYLAVSLVKFTDGEDYTGIRFNTNSSTAWIPVYFHFTGVVSDVVKFNAISTDKVSNVVPFDMVDNQYQISSSQIFTPNFKAPKGTKKAVYVDDAGNWSIN